MTRKHVCSYFLKGGCSRSHCAFAGGVPLLYDVPTTCGCLPRNGRRFPMVVMVTGWDLGAEPSVTVRSMFDVKAAAAVLDDIAEQATLLDDITEQVRRGRETLHGRARLRGRIRYLTGALRRAAEDGKYGGRMVGWSIELVSCVMRLEDVS